MALEITVTTAGRAALVNAQNTGTAPVVIAQIGFSSTAVTPTPAATTLPGEFKRIAGVAGDVVANDVIHINAIDSSAAAYSLRSFALYLGDGTLFALYGQAGIILEKTAASDAMLAIDAVFADINAASLTFGATNFLNPPATTERQGVVELATLAEAQAGIDALRALTPAVAKAAILGWLLAQDGAGSGLDADLLDGRQAAEFALLAGAAFSGTISAPGFNLTGVNAPLISGRNAVGSELGFLQFDATNTYLGHTSGSVRLMASGTTVFSARQGTAHVPGDLGIGTAAPIARLHVNTASSAPTYAVVGNNNGGAVLGVDAAAMATVASYAGSGIKFGNFNAGGAFATHAVITPGGNLGIGTTDPLFPLTVGAANGARLEFTAGVAANVAQIQAYNRVANGYINLITDAGYHNIRIAGSDVVIIDGNRNVGIGAPSAGTKLRVAGTARIDSWLEVAGTISAQGGVVMHTGNDGAGSGYDADLLDGQHGSYYADVVARLGYTPLNNAAYTAADVRTKLLTVDGSGSGIDADLLDGQQGSFYLPAGNYTAADVLAKLLSVDGAGSGLDADMLDGRHASEFPLASDFSQSIALNGYQKLPSGLIVQWGRVILGPFELSKVVALPITFPNAIFGAQMSNNNYPISSVDESDEFMWVEMTSTSSLTFGSWGDGFASRTVSFFVIGY